MKAIEWTLIDFLSGLDLLHHELQFVVFQYSKYEELTNYLTL